MLAKYLKRFCSMLVAVAMLLSCMPLIALAETDENAAAQSMETSQDDAPAAQDAGTSQEAAEPVASVEIPVAVQTVVDKAEETMTEVAQSQQATAEELENKLDSVGKAEAAVEDLEDLTDSAEGKVDDLETAIPNVQDAVNKETVTVEQGKEALEAQHAETEAALDAAKQQQEKAAAALELAKQEYEAAKTQSEEAQAAAMEKLLAAQEELAKAEQGTAAAKQAVDAVAEALNGIQNAVDQAQENTGALVEDLKAGLEESKEELKAAVENLTQATDEIKENTETLITELENLQASAEKFEESVGTAKTTEEKVLDMRADYEEAMKALEAAQAAYDALVAEGGDVSDEDIQKLSNAIDAAKAIAAEMKTATDAYETEAAKVYEKNLQILGSNEATDEEKAAAKKAVAGTLVGKQANGQTVRWVETDETTYGKSESGFYVVLNDKGEVVGRYGYKVENGALNVYEMTSSGSVYSVELNGVETVIDTTKTEIEIKDAEGNTVTIYKDGETGNNYYYKEECEVVDVVKYTDVAVKENTLVSNDNINLIKDQDRVTSFTYTINTKLFGSYEVPFNVNDDGSITIGDVDSLTDKKWIKEAINAVINSLDLSSAFETKKVEYKTVNGTKLEVKDGRYFLGETEVFFDAEGNGYFKKDAGVTESSDFKNLTFTMGNVSNSDSAAAYGEKKEEAIANLNEANTKLSKAQDDYNAAETQYKKLQAELDRKAKAEAKDLEVVVSGSSIGGSLDSFIPGLGNIFDNIFGDNETTVGNLADLPVSIDELVNIEDFQDSEKQKELLEAMQNIGSGGISSMTALYQLVGLDAADIAALAAAETAGTDFQKEYAAAWVAALTAKVNVIISGFELVEQAGKTVEAGKELLASGVGIDDKILSVAQNAAKVAGYTGALGVVQLGNNAHELTSEILTQLESKVAFLQMETNAAAKEVSAAKAALDEVIKNYRDPYATAIKEAKERLDLAESKYNELVKNLDQAYADLNVAYTKIGAISAPQKSAESEKRAGTFVLDETRFQMKDTNNKVLHFPYTLKGSTLTLNVTEVKSVIVIEVAYMAELVNQGIQVVEFKTANGTYVLNMAAFLKANPTVEGTVEVSLEAATYSFVLNGKTVTEKMELKK